MLPISPEEHLDSLRTAYSAGDILALIQAIQYAQAEDRAVPTWALNPLTDIFAGIATKSVVGTKGKGNSPFGWVRKAFIRTVRASVYHSVRAWQKDPDSYADLPTATILFWYAETNADGWSGSKTYRSAARLSQVGLKGTEFAANSATIRKAAMSFPRPVQFGRHEAEIAMGLRGPAKVFGLPPGGPPSHVKLLLSKTR